MIIGHHNWIEEVKISASSAEWILIDGIRGPSVRNAPSLYPQACFGTFESAARFSSVWQLCVGLGAAFSVEQTYICTDKIPSTTTLGRKMT